MATGAQVPDKGLGADSDRRGRRGQVRPRPQSHGSGISLAHRPRPKRETLPAPDHPRNRGDFKIVFRFQRDTVTGNPSNDCAARFVQLPRMGVTDDAHRRLNGTKEGSLTIPDHAPEVRARHVVAPTLPKPCALGHRIVVLSRRPGRIRDIVEIEVDLRNRDSFEGIQSHLWDLVREKTRAADTELMQARTHVLTIRRRRTHRA